jgi:hypothetical protein
MSVTLDDSWIKLARGKEHLAVLSQACGEYLDTGPEITVEMYNDPITGSVETRFLGEPSPPPRIGAIVGDVVHNMWFRPRRSRVATSDCQRRGCRP